MTVEYIDIKIREDGSRVIRRNLNDVGNEANKTANAVDFLKRTLASLGVGLAVREILQMADAYTHLQNRLRSTGLEGIQLTAVYRALKDVANDTRSSLEGSVELYSRLALSSKELGVSQAQLIDFTKALNQAINLSGASASEAQAGLIQLSQGMASGTLRGDELRSVLEQLPAVADVIAKGLGVTRGQLRKMGEDGKITAGVILKAFQDARGELNDRFAKSVPTMGQAFQVLKNNVIDFVGEMDKTLGVSAAISKAMLFLANNLQTVVYTVMSLVSGLVLVGGTAAAISLAARAMQALTLAIATNPIGALLVVLVSAVTALTLFRDKIMLGIDSVTTLGDLFRAFGEIVGSVFSSIVQWAQGAFGPLIEWLRSWVGEVNISVVGVLRFVARGVDSFIGLWRGAIAAVVTLFKGIPGAIAEIFVVALNLLLEKIGKFVNAAGELLSTVTEFAGLGKLATVDLKLTNENEGAVKKLGQDVAAAFTEGFQSSNGAEKLLDGVLDRAKAFGDARAEAARLAARHPMRVSTAAGPAAPAMPDEKALRALEKLRNELRSLLNQIAPTEGALLDMAKGQKLLDEALSKTIISQEAHARYTALLKQHYADAINPLGKYNRELDEQASLLRVTAKERGVEAELQRISKDLTAQGVPLLKEETAALRAKLQALRDLNAVVEAQDQLLANSVGARENFKTQLEAIKNLLADQSSGFTSSDATSALSNMLPGMFEGTQELIQVQLDQFKDMYAQIEQMQTASLISHQTAEQMKAKVAVQYNEMRLRDTQTFFGTLASLQNSGNKKLAAIGRAAAVAQATIDGILAVQKALASFPPPVNFAMAAVVGVTAAANVAQILQQGKGYEQGGYTGDFGRQSVAGVVHGREFVVNADATSRHRELLEAMNRGHSIGYEAGGYAGPQAPITTNSGFAVGGGGANVSVVVNNLAAGTEATVQKRETDQGVELEVTVQRIVSRDIREGGMISDAIEQQYGSNRATGTVY